MIFGDGVHLFNLDVSDDVAYWGYLLGSELGRYNLEDDLRLPFCSDLWLCLGTCISAFLSDWGLKHLSGWYLSSLGSWDLSNCLGGECLNILGCGRLKANVCQFLSDLLD